MSQATILGVSIDLLTSKDVVDQIDQRIQERQKTFIATVNPEFIMEAKRDKQFQDLLNRADFAVADGIGILWAATYLAYQPKIKMPMIRQIDLYVAAIGLGFGTLISCRIRNSVIPEQITGVDLSCKLAALAAAQGYAMFLLGAQPGVAERAGEELQRQISGLKISGTYAGNGNPAGDTATRQELARCPAHIVLVAYGAPKQEYWITRNLNHIPEYVAMGVGGTLMYISGQTHRAPEWVRRFGAEWLFRLITQPWRWKRQLSLIKFIFTVISYKMANE